MLRIEIVIRASIPTHEHTQMNVDMNACTDGGKDKNWIEIQVSKGSNFHIITTARPVRFK